MLGEDSLPSGGAGSAAQAAEAVAPGEIAQKCRGETAVSEEATQMFREVESQIVENEKATESVEAIEKGAILKTRAKRNRKSAAAEAIRDKEAQIIMLQKALFEATKDQSRKTESYKDARPDTPKSSDGEDDDSVDRVKKKKKRASESNLNSNPPVTATAAGAREIPSPTGNPGVINEKFVFLRNQTSKFFAAQHAPQVEKKNRR